MTMNLLAYRRPALQFSGGKDSLACLYKLRDKLDQLTVYWLNTQDVCDETLAVIEHVRPWIPNFEEVRSDVKAWRAENGIPSDILPTSCTELGNLYGLSALRVSDRFACCAANRMLPLHQRMLQDGVDLVIRGTKLSDTGRLPAEGRTPWYELWLPLRDWSREQVFEYLESVNAPRNSLYDYFKSASAMDCLGCTALWGEDKATYFRARHPERLSEYSTTLQALRGELRKHMQQLDTQIKECEPWQ